MEKLDLELLMNFYIIKIRELNSIRMTDCINVPKFTDSMFNRALELSQTYKLTIGEIIVGVDLIVEKLLSDYSEPIMSDHNIPVFKERLCFLIHIIQENGFKTINNSVKINKKA